MNNLVSLRDDTLIVKDEDSYLVYSPFRGKISRVANFPDQGSGLESQLRSVGFFAPVPGHVAPDTVGNWKGFQSLTLLLTRRCNVSCKYCYAKAQPVGEDMPKELALVALEWFLKQLTNDRVRITFHGGGEPTLVEQTIRLVVERTEELRGQKSAHYLITTNGTASLEFMDWMMDQRFGISISMDGPPEIQDRNRPMANGEPSSPLVERTIRQMVHRNYRFTVRVTYSPKDDIVQVARYLASLGVRSLHLEPLFPFGREYSVVAFGKKSNYDVYSPIGAELLRKFLEAVDVCHELGIRLYNGHLTNFTKGIGYFCGAASGRAMMVTHDGLLTGCLEVVDAQDQDVKTFGLGRWIPEERIFAVDTQRLAMFQDRHADALPECKTCYARYHCAGGCAVKAVRATGDFFDRDVPYCGFTKGLVPVLVRRIAKKTGI